MFNRRPSRTDDLVVFGAARALFQALVDILPDFRDDDEEECVEQIASAIEHEDDGYRIGRILDQDGWDIDMTIATALDSAAFHKMTVLNDLTKKWVNEFQIKPTLEVGTKVLVKTRFQKQAVGEIVDVRVATAEYVVNVPSAGHVKTGCGTRGLVLACEDVVAAPAEPRAACSKCQGDRILDFDGSTDRCPYCKGSGVE